MKQILIIALILAVSGLTACKTYLYENMFDVQYGTSSAQVIKDESNLVDEKPVQLKGTNLDPNSTYTILFAKMRSTVMENYWVYGFKNDKLIYWGYPYQFLRNSDPEIRALGVEATKYLVNEEYLKATLQ